MIEVRQDRVEEMAFDVNIVADIRGRLCFLNWGTDRAEFNLKMRVTGVDVDYKAFVKHYETRGVPTELDSIVRFPYIYNYNIKLTGDWVGLVPITEDIARELLLRKSWIDIKDNIIEEDMEKEFIGWLNGGVAQP